jgi:hypothetical protein
LSRDERTGTDGAARELVLIPAWRRKPERLDELVLMLIKDGLIVRWQAQIEQVATSG